MSNECDDDSGTDGEIDSGSAFDDSAHGLVTEDGRQRRGPMAIDERQVTVADRHCVDGDSNLVTTRRFEDDVFDRQRSRHSSAHGGADACAFVRHVNDRSPRGHECGPAGWHGWRADGMRTCDHGIVLRSSRRLFVTVGLVGVVVIGCRNQEQRTQLPPPTTSADSAMASPTDPPATMPPTSTAEKVIPESGTPPTESVYLEVDADGEVPVFASTVIGSPVRVVISSSTERSFRLRNDGTSLTGTAVAFEFVADDETIYDIVDAVSGEVIVSLESILD